MAVKMWEAASLMHAARRQIEVKMREVEKERSKHARRSGLPVSLPPLSF